ncbi:prepilin-type N-terminal cleavage/methylation domain-containing protein [Candidatus Daviesbacteria bacterium]|nr:prepilin-type N-terminal cleavage/methylation domain-containing protein [Candidatus Daviesbacteria bacterium]
MRGFTLIELILVVAIISFIALLSSPFYSRFLLQNAVDNTKDQLVGSLRKAQTYSMMGKRGSAWSVNFSTNTITLYKGTSFASRDASFDEKFSVNPNVSVAGITDISFARATGLPAPAGATINISSANNNKSVTVNSQGVVSR